MSFALAILAYLVPTFITGYVWHLKLFHAQYTALGIYRPDMLIPLGFASMVVQGVIFAWMYPRLFSTSADAWVRSGLLAAATFAVLSWSFTTLAVGAKHPMTSVVAYLRIETAFTVVQFALVGPLLALAWRGAVVRP